MPPCSRFKNELRSEATLIVTESNQKVVREGRAGVVSDVFLSLLSQPSA